MVKHVIRTFCWTIIFLNIISNVVHGVEQPKSVRISRVVSVEDNRVAFCAVGDVMLDRGVKYEIMEHGKMYPFFRIARFVRSKDLAFCNMECAISGQGEPLNKNYRFRIDPSVIDGIKKSGFNVFCLANNHTFDYGEKAMLDTKRVLETNGFVTVGLGKTRQESAQARIIVKKGIKFAVLAYVNPVIEGVRHSKNFPGPAYMDLGTIVSEIKQVRAKVDYVIVSLHWGAEYSFSPTADQQKIAYKIIDAGADLILGHHPHVMQTIEKYKDKYIVYSMGNFIFNPIREPGKQTFIFCCTFTKRKISSSYIVPIYIDKFRPNFAKGIQFSLITNKIKKDLVDNNVNFIHNWGDKVILLD
jgi:poly-gamma-glutamate synthesis protein (capsule biosynthesis protein)